MRGPVEFGGALGSFLKRTFEEHSGASRFSAMFRDLKSDDSTRQLMALTELSEYLSFSSEEALISFPMETFIPVLTSLLEDNGQGDETAAQASTLPSHLCKNTGKIRSYSPENGFGFIVCESVQGDVFLSFLSIIGEHPPKVTGYPNSPAMGPEMRFDIEIRNGKPRATNASLVTEASTETTQTPQKSEASESLSDSLMASRIEEEHGEYEDMLPQDILKMLPKDAPDCVWKYLKQLEALAKA
jgi:cold shock CspA family protein